MGAHDHQITFVLRDRFENDRAGGDPSLDVGEDWGMAVPAGPFEHMSRRWFRFRQDSLDLVENLRVHARIIEEDPNVEQVDFRIELRRHLLDERKCTV